MDKKQVASVWYFVGVFLLLMVLQNYVFAPRVDTLSYAEFKTLVEKGKVSDVAVGEQLITGRLNRDGLEGLLPKARLEALAKAGTGEQQFMTVRVGDPTLVLRGDRQPGRRPLDIGGLWTDEASEDIQAPILHEARRELLLYLLLQEDALSEAVAAAREAVAARAAPPP